MTGERFREFWRLARRQRGVATRVQLLQLGFSAKAIEHLIATGRLFPLWRGVYAVGRPDVTREARWLAATLACGSGSELDFGSAATLWGLGEYEGDQIEIAVPAEVKRRHPGIRVSRRAYLAEAVRMTHKGIPVSSPTRTILDMATRLDGASLERLINQAAVLDLVSPDELRAAIEPLDGQRGVRRLRTILDRRTFRFTDSALEAAFLSLARRAGLPVPETGVRLNGFRVDFFFRELGLVVETDGLRYHRTPQQQARDRLRDQAHTAADLTPLRFTHGQVRYEPDHVIDVLQKVAEHLPRHRGANGSVRG